MRTGLLVIGDVKRGDIGSTSAAVRRRPSGRSAVFDEMDDFVTPDAITVNPFLGLDTLEPFVKTAIDFDKGLFVLVRTSNPGSADLQDVKTEDGRTFSEMLADKLAALAQRSRSWSDRAATARSARSSARRRRTRWQSLRERLPQSIFLLPGYGTQGATAEMTKAAFKDGKGAIVSASRSILYAHREKKYAGLAWEDAVKQAVVDMAAELQIVW